MFIICMKTISNCNALNSFEVYFNTTMWRTSAYTKFIIFSNQATYRKPGKLRRPWRLEVSESTTTMSVNNVYCKCTS